MNRIPEKNESKKEENPHIRYIKLNNNRSKSKSKDKFPPSINKIYDPFLARNAPETKNIIHQNKNISGVVSPRKLSIGTK